MQGLLVCGCPSAMQGSSAGVMEQGKTLKLTWVTTLSHTSCCTVDHKAAMAVWARGLPEE